MKNYFVLEKITPQNNYIQPSNYVQLDYFNAGAIIYVDDFTKAYRFESPIDAEMFITVRDLNMEDFNLFRTEIIAFKVPFEKTIVSIKN